MNEQPNWTPGPWTHRLNSMGHIWWVLAKEADGTRHVAEVLGSPREADARLIAASPELYEALDWMAGLFNEATTEGVFADALTHARAALAKARGVNLQQSGEGK